VTSLAPYRYQGHNVISRVSFRPAVRPDGDRNNILRRRRVARGRRLKPSSDCHVYALQANSLAISTPDPLPSLMDYRLLARAAHSPANGAVPLLRHLRPSYLSWLIYGILCCRHPNRFATIRKDAGGCGGMNASEKYGTGQPFSNILRAALSKLWEEEGSSLEGGRRRQVLGSGRHERTATGRRRACDALGVSLARRW